MFLTKYGADGKIDVEIDGPTALDNLRRSIGWELTKGRDALLAEAIQNPTKFLTDRNAEIEKLFKADGAVTLVYAKTLEDYLNAGLPEDIAKNYALQYAKEDFDRHLTLLELKSPGAYKRAFGTAEIQREAKDAVVNIATQKEETVAEYKARKRAKKAAKRQQKALGQ